MRLTPRKTFAAMSAALLLSFGSIHAQRGSDITFKALAVTYPEGTEVEVEMSGTEIGLKASGKAISGKATIKHERGATQISLRIGGFSPASRLGEQYTTYVLWAVTPEGKIDNLGEFRRRPSDTWDAWIGSPFKTATPFQTFALIITAEPYGLVDAPSRTVVVSSRAPKDRAIDTQDATVRFAGDSEVELLRFTPDKEIGKEEYKKIPVELLGARRAIDVARFFQAEQLAPETYKRAYDTWQSAEQQFSFRQYDDSATTAQTAIRLAEAAREVSVERRKAKEIRDLIGKKDEEIAALEDSARASERNRTDAEKKLEIEHQGRVSAEAQLDKLDRDHQRAISDIKRYTDDLARLSNNLDASRKQNDDLRAQVKDLQAQLDQTKSKEEAARKAAQILSALNAAFESRKDDRGTVVIISDDFFSGAASTELSASGKTKLKSLLDYAMATDNKIRIESYTDDTGTSEHRLDFTDKRGQAVASYLILGGVQGDRVTAYSLGGNKPRTSNRTAAGRAKNRRVEVVFLN